MKENGQNISSKKKRHIRSRNQIKISGWACAYGQKSVVTYTYFVMTNSGIKKCRVNIIFWFLEFSHIIVQKVFSRW